MPNRTALRATLILALVAALLAFSAAALTYSRRGQIDARPLGGGLLMVTVGMGAWARLRGGTIASADPPEPR